MLALMLCTCSYCVHILCLHGAEMGWWKLCPHIHHPSPQFQAAMTPLGSHGKVYNNTVRLAMPIYLDLWPMWPVPENVTSCSSTANVTSRLDSILATPWGALMPTESSAGSAVTASKLPTPCDFKVLNPSLEPSQTNAAKLPASKPLEGAQDRVHDFASQSQRWCILYGLVPFRGAAQEVQIGARKFPTPVNQER